MNAEIIKAKASKIVMMANMLRSTALPMTAWERDETIRLIVKEATLIHEESSK